MNRAIIMKTARDSALFLAAVVIVVIIFEALIVFAMGQFSHDIASTWTRMPFIKRIVSALVGADVAADITYTNLLTIGLAHPFMYAVTWAFLITTCTRITAGEVDRGTADLLLTLPVSRTAVYFSASIVVLAACILITLAPWLGLAVGARFFQAGDLAEDGNDSVDISRFRFAILNLFCLQLAVAAVIIGLSTFASRRGPAVAAALAVLLWSFLWNFIVTLLPSWNWSSFLGLLHYYRPLENVRNQNFGLPNVASLLLIASVAWTVGLLHFRRRDIHAA